MSQKTLVMIALPYDTHISVPLDMVDKILSAQIYKRHSADAWEHKPEEKLSMEVVTSDAITNEATNKHLKEERDRFREYWLKDSNKASAAEKRIKMLEEEMKTHGITIPEVN